MDKHKRVLCLKEKFYANSGSRVKKILDLDRFPYTYHHDWFRTNYSSPTQITNDSLMSRSDVAAFMEKLYGDDPAQYAEMIVGGALAYVFEDAMPFLRDLFDVPPENYTVMLENYKNMRILADNANSKLNEYLKRS